MPRLLHQQFPAQIRTVQHNLWQAHPQPQSSIGRCQECEAHLRNLDDYKYQDLNQDNLQQTLYRSQLPPTHHN